jgi:hypothetical protein
MAFAQEIQWIRQFGTEEPDAACGVSVDGAGNIYVVGRTYGTLPGQEGAGGADAFVRKYDGNGNEIWTRQFGTEGDDSAEGVSVDMAGNVYVVGLTEGTFPGQRRAGRVDAFVCKFDGNGNEIWTRQFGTEYDDIAFDVSVDMAGNVYVVGYIDGIAVWEQKVLLVESGDAFIRKFNGNGNEIWTRQFGTERSDGANDVSVDMAGNVYVVGWTGGTFPGQRGKGDWDAFVRRYDGNGNEIWTRQFGTEGDDAALAMDMAGNVYVVGRTEGTFPGQRGAGKEDAFVCKYDGNGNEIWTRQFGTEGTDYAWGVSVDMVGNVYVVGLTGGTFPGQRGAGKEDAFIRKFDGGGNEIWTRQFGTEYDDIAFDVSVDDVGNIYVVGWTYGTLPGQKGAGGADAFIIKFWPGPKHEPKVTLEAATYFPAIPGEQITISVEDPKYSGAILGRRVLVLMHSIRGILKSWDSIDGKRIEFRLPSKDLPDGEIIAIYTDPSDPSRRAIARAKVTNKWRFAIITDLHIGRDIPNYDGREYYLTKRLREIVKWLNDNARSSTIKLLCVLGDISDKGLYTELKKAQEILDTLSIPYVPLLGNHDDDQGDKGENFRFVFHPYLKREKESKLRNVVVGFQMDEDPVLENYAFICGGILFICLDWTPRTPSWAFWAIPHGATLDWLKTQLNWDFPVILLSHHPLVKKPENAFSDLDEIEEILKPHSERILWSFAGHIHGFNAWNSFWEKWESANRVFPPIFGFIPVETTEAMMVGPNDPNLERSCLRLVEIKEGKVVRSGTIRDAYRYALNPNFTSELDLNGYTFTANCYTNWKPLSYTWEFGGGKISRKGEVVTLSSEDLRSLGGGLERFYLPVKLRVSYAATEEEIEREVEINTSPITPILLASNIVATAPETGHTITGGNQSRVPVLLKAAASAPKPFALITVDFDKAKDAIDLSRMRANVDLAERKAFFYMDSWPEEVHKEKVLLIPSTGTGQVYLCPDALSISDVNPSDSAIFLRVGEYIDGFWIDIYTIEGQDYYAVFGVTGNGIGGGEVSGKPQPRPRMEELVLCAPHPVGKEGCIFFLKIPENAVHATLNIYSVNGALILSIPIDPSKDRYPITGKWVPQDNNGRPLGSGIYFYLVKVRYSDGRIERSKVQKLVIKR